MARRRRRYNRRNRNRLYIKAGLIIAPFLLAASVGAGFVVNILKGDFEDAKRQKGLQDLVTKEQEYEEQNEIPSTIEEIPEIKEENPMPSEEAQEYVKEETEVVEDIEVVQEIDYPEIITPVEYQEVSDELLASGYEFQNIDFEVLKDINEDSCAWLCIDGTNINLPIVQGEDNEHYLHYDIEGNESKSGTLFVDYRNNSLEVPANELSDFSIVYGHNMSGGRMLAPICNYKSQAFYDNHSFGILYTPDGFAYEVEFFAGVIIDGEDESEVFTSDIIDEEVYTNYINNIRNNSTFESDVSVEYGDKVLALVTCSYETNNSRYVLYAVLNKQYTNYNQFASNDNLTYSKKMN